MQFRKRGEFIYAHRLALLIDGRLPDEGQVVLHSCNNRACVNPSHLKWGTQRENMQQAILQGRAPHHGRVAGVKNGNAKLDEDRVRQIRSRHTESRKALAEEFGVTPALISAIILRRAWQHV
ncbi:HNH endonuclease [Qipengyuania flava]|uniref:HNH endonuclease n=1 Tax=Qipengyuania flava TaxID=192812 RepID=UPI0039F57E0D